jgi:hypothetical protein
MTSELYEHLKQQFYLNNHAKYKKYFEEWVSNLTSIQIEYFEIEKENIKNLAKFLKKN